MLGSPLKTFEHRYFYSINNKDDGQVIPDYYATDIQNWLIRNRGQLEMRDGLTARGTSPSATNLGEAVLYRADGTKHLVRVINGAGNTSKFQYSSDEGLTWVDITGGGSRATDRVWKFIQANNSLYGVNGTDTPIKYDTASITTVVAIPNGTAIEWWKNHMWIIGVSATPDRAYFSNANDPETWGGSDFINVNLGDQSPGVGLKGTGGASAAATTGGRLYIGKQRSVWYIVGSSSSNWALSILTYEHGVASHESMTSVKNDVWCVDMEGNIRGLYRTTEDTPFSSLKSWAIQATIAGLNKAAITKSSAKYFSNYAMFFLPYGVDDYNSIVLVFDTLANEGKGGWITFTGWRIARTTVFNGTTPKLFLHDARVGNGQVYEWTGVSDNGQAIVSHYDTKIYDHGVPEREKHWKFAYQFAPVIGDINLDFYVSIDRYYFVRLKRINLQGTGNKKLGVDWTLGTDKLGSDGFVRDKINYTDSGGDSTGYCQQVRLRAESATTKIKIREFTSHYRVKGLR